ncbi:MAG: Nif3-like dinuclear metal center hexameric protein [Bacteroidales bacterium]|nr:Nif3-like dinuclear metal center hexameric protein [Bacteroidales bacterium]
MKLKEITKCIEELAPLSFQESYDNSGLLLGSCYKIIKSALITLDITESIIDEAIQKKCNLIISHHPLIFSGLKRLSGNTFVERILLKAIKNDIAIYSVHTNIDNVINGVNSILAQKIGLKNLKILSPKSGLLQKLVTFCPSMHAEKVRNAIFEAGAGNIGNYSSCSFNSDGKGSFQASDNTNPFVGKLNELHFEDEIRIETIFPTHKTSEILNALLDAHPYEEVAYDIYPLENEFANVGSGIIGELENSEDETVFLNRIKKICKADCLRHSKKIAKNVKKIAICGGSGSFLIDKAIASNADVFISGDIKYHDFFKADNKIVIADIGHFESEQFVKDLLYSILIKKFPNFALQISEVNTNAVYYT